MFLVLVRSSLVHGQRAKIFIVLEQTLKCSFCRYMRRANWISSLPVTCVFEQLPKTNLLGIHWRHLPWLLNISLLLTSSTRNYFYKLHAHFWNFYFFFLDFDFFNGKHYSHFTFTSWRNQNVKNKNRQRSTYLLDCVCARAIETFLCSYQKTISMIASNASVSNVCYTLLTLRIMHVT